LPLPINNLIKATSLDGIKQSADLLKEENIKEKDPLMIVENGGGNLLTESKATETVELKTHLKEREKVKRRKKGKYFLNTVFILIDSQWFYFSTLQFCVVILETVVQIETCFY